MEFNQLLQQRYSVRGYQARPVEEDKLLEVLEAARLAPTAANRQPFRIIVIHTEGREEALKKVYHREWITQAPLILAVCSVPAEAWVRSDDGKNYADVDAAIVMDHIILAATNVGLGTCWIAAFNPQAAREVLGLPDGVEPVVLTPLGYPGIEPGERARKPLNEIIHYERW